jgi:hypothetical protein
MPRPEILEAHKHSIRNEEELSRSGQAGCFNCCQSYDTAQVTEWTLERDERRTALCPKCGIDSVIGDAAGYPVTDLAWLKEMCAHWFD